MASSATAIHIGQYLGVGYPGVHHLKPVMAGHEQVVRYGLLHLTISIGKIQCE